MLKARGPRYRARSAAAALILLITSIAACRHGQAHADLILLIRNQSAGEATVRWTTKGILPTKGVAFVAASNEETEGLEAGDYIITIDGGDGAANLSVPLSTADAPTRILSVGRDLALTLE